MQKNTNTSVAKEELQKLSISMRPEMAILSMSESNTTMS